MTVGRPAEAIPHLARAVEIAPSNAKAHANLGAVLANEGRVSEALPHFERALELNPGDDAARRNLTEAKRLAGR